MKSPCNHRNIDRDENYENSTNDITLSTIVSKSCETDCGETDDNTNQCEKINDIVHKTGRDIHFGEIK